MSKNLIRWHLKNQLLRHGNMSSTPGNPSFTSNFNGSSSTQTKTDGASTLNELWKLVEKQQVDDVIIEFFLCMCNSF
jgi:hypothetical protein